jgi:hypothetical protein
MQDGFWIFEAALTTTADVALQIVSWWTWTGRCRGWDVLADFLDGFTKKNKAAEMSVRGVLAMSVKIPITSC